MFQPAPTVHWPGNLKKYRFSNGELVGQDEQGNTYYRTKGRKIDPTLGFERRWVIYNGYAEATRVPRRDALRSRRKIAPASSSGSRPSSTTQVADSRSA